MVAIFQARWKVRLAEAAVAGMELGGYDPILTVNRSERPRASQRGERRRRHPDDTRFLTKPCRLPQISPQELAARTDEPMSSRRLYAALARALLAGWRISPASGLGRLRHRWESCTTACGASDLYGRFAGFQRFHGGHFPDRTPTQAMSLCSTACWLRLSHFRLRRPNPSR